MFIIIHFKLFSTYTSKRKTLVLHLRALFLSFVFGQGFVSTPAKLWKEIAPPALSGSDSPGQQSAGWLAFHKKALRENQSLY